MTDKEVTLHHFPMEDFHPMMDPSTNEYSPTLDPARRVVLDTLDPAATLQPSPTTVFGPMVANGSITAVGWMIQFPTMLSPVARVPVLCSYWEARYIFCPER